jgi:hypothetical protein
LLVELTNPAGLPTSAGSANLAGDAALDGSASAGLATPVQPPLNGSGTGLIGLTERARLTGGELDQGVSADGQFRLRAWLPWPTSPSEQAEPPESTDAPHPAGPQ